MLYVLVAIGLNIVVGYAGLLDLGYVAFFAIGAYTVGVLTSAHGEPAGSGPRCRSRSLVAMLAGLVLGTPTLRLRGDYLAIVTLGFGEIIRITAEQHRLARRPARHHEHPSARRASGRCTSSGLNAKPYYYLGLTFIILVILMVRASSTAASAAHGRPSGRTRTRPS